MIRMSMLRNYPVICSSQRIGFLESVSLDEARKRVRALIVTSGMRGKRIVPAEAIRAIADRFILVERVEKYNRIYELSSLGFIRDTTGLLIGRITDYAIDEEKLSVIAVEMMRGYLSQERNGKLWIFSYAASEQRAGELIVPTFLGCGLMDQKEETETCAFQP